MKKLSLIALAFGVLLILGLGTASAETTVETTWEGYSGSLSETFTAGDDAKITMDTVGNYIEGEFNAVDKDNDPYGYGVDSVTTNTRAMVDGGGQIKYIIDRTDSKESMYGSAGQESYSWITTTDYGEMNYRSGTNYASMTNSNYGFQSNKQFKAAGDFNIQHGIYDGDGSGAYVDGSANNGEMYVTVMGEKARGSGFDFGSGSATGCYQNIEAEGSGDSVSFESTAYAENYLEGEDWNMPNGGVHSETWTGDFHAKDFWSRGN